MSSKQSSHGDVRLAAREPQKGRWQGGITARRSPALHVQVDEEGHDPCWQEAADVIARDLSPAVDELDPAQVLEDARPWRLHADPTDSRGVEKEVRGTFSVTVSYTRS